MAKPMHLPAHRPSEEAPSRQYLLALLLLLGVGIGGAVTLVQRWTRPVVDVAAVIAEKDQAIGMAENGQFAQASAAFTKLAARFPADPLVLRNLVVARLGAFEQRSAAAAPPGEKPPEDAAAPPVSAPELAAAAEQLLKAEPDAPISYLLASRAALVLRRRSRETAHSLPDALEAAETAARLAPDNAMLAFNVYELSGEAEYVRDPGHKQAGYDALLAAHRLDPQNLAVLAELLEKQVQQKAADLGPTLESAKLVLSPLQQRVLRQQKADLEQLRAAALAASQKGDWSAATVAVRTLKRLLQSQDALKSDRRRVSANNLEFLRHDFSDDFFWRHGGRPVAAPIAAATVQFGPLPTDPTIASLNDLRDVKLADVDLDGALDLVVLHSETLAVYHRPLGKGEWRKLAATPIPTGMRRILIADLDRDAAKLPNQGAGRDKAGATDPSPAARGGTDAPSLALRASEDSMVFTPSYLESQACEQAFVDFVLWGDGLCIVRNEADEQFPHRKLTRVDGPAVPDDQKSLVRDLTAAILVDFDHDGDLDLVTAAEDQGLAIWLSLGNATFRFADHRQWSRLPPKSQAVTSLAAVDWDRDLDLDILVGGPHGEKGKSAPPVGLLENLGHGQLRWLPLDKDYSPLAGGRSLAVAEIDGNVSWDLISVGERGVQAALTTTQPGAVRFLKSQSVAETAADDLLCWDYDNDTLVDILCWSKTGVQVYHGKPDATWEVGALGLESLVRPGEHPLHGADVGDLDGDGDLDLVLFWADQLLLAENNCPRGAHWLAVRLAGRENDKGRANNSGLGALIEVRTPARYQAQVVTRNPTHFGLGDQSQANLIRLLFSNGVPQAARNTAGDRAFCEKMELVGSCPFLYAWNGERFEFFTDLLWAAPLGLQIAEGKTLPSRPWEYLKIPGERLSPRGDAYELRLTEELWEAAYFDRVELIAVDHPPEVEVYSNEKVGPAEISAFKIHTVRQPRRPVAARDKHGRDVLEKISRADGDYARLFDGNVWQGLVDEHFLEFDLGQLEPSAQNLTLFLTGWIYPTDASINVNLSQSSEEALPQPPSLWAADGQGGWKVVQPYMGFPGGKTKTIAVAVPAAALAPKDRRLRIVTSSEIYWDDVFFTVDETPAEVRQAPLPMLSADLHYRGFSGETPLLENSPKTYDYSQVQTAPKWPPMQGRFTRYGDVHPLLLADDDRLVVLGSGDELTLRFQIPPPPPPGWKRDFILHNVGWDKDANLNVIFGQSSEPYPYQRMPSYPNPTGDAPDTAEYREYLESYQTRQQSPRRFWRGMKWTMDN